MKITKSTKFDWVHDEEPDPANYQTDLFDHVLNEIEDYQIRVKTLDGVIVAGDLIRDQSDYDSIRVRSYRNERQGGVQWLVADILCADIVSISAS